MEEKIEPNVYQLSHKDIKITYACPALGEQQLTFYDPAHPEYPRNFSRQDMRLERAAPGLLVSVYLQNDNEKGVLSLTVIIPNVELAGKAKRPLETFAILTTHRYDPNKQIHTNATGEPAKGSLF